MNCRMSALSQSPYLNQMAYSDGPISHNVLSILLYLYIIVKGVSRSSSDKRGVQQGTFYLIFDRRQWRRESVVMSCTDDGSVQLSILRYTRKRKSGDDGWRWDAVTMRVVVVVTASKRKR